MTKENPIWTIKKDEWGNPISADRDCPNPEKTGTAYVVRKKAGGFLAHYDETDNTLEGNGKQNDYFIDLEDFNDGCHPEDMYEATKVADAWLKENGII